MNEPIINPLQGEISPLEIAAVNFFKTAWRAKVLLLFFPAVFVAIYAVFAAYDQYRSYVPNYLYAVQLTFDGSRRGEYPNGNPFSAFDITDTRVTEKVFRKHELDRYGWSLSNLKDSVSISARGTEHFAIMREFEILSNKWAKTIDELEQVKADIQNRLRSSANGQVEISLLDRNADLPPQVAKNVLMDMVSVWAEISVNERGVVSIQIATIPSSTLGLNAIVDPASLEALSTLDQQLKSISSFVAELSKQPGVNSAIDPETGKSIVSVQRDLATIEAALRQLPTGWSMDVSRYVGKNILPVEMFTRNILASELISNEDYLVALDLVEERIGLLREDIVRLVAQPMGGRITDPETGYSAYEIDRLLSDIIDVDLSRLRGALIEYGITRDESGVRLFYETQINQLLRDKEELKQQASVVQSALNDGQKVFRSGTVSALEERNGSVIAPAAQVSLPQVGDGFIDRLLELSQKSTSNDFLKNLIEQNAEIQLREVKIDARIARLKYYIDRIEAPEVASLATDQEKTGLEKKLINFVEEKLPAVMLTLQGYADAVNRIAARLAYADEIHKTLFDGSENAPPVSNFLLNSPSSLLTVDKIVMQMQQSNDAAIRILDILNINNLNADGKLYRAISSVESEPLELFGVKSILGAILAAVIGLVVALLAIGYISVSRSSRAGI